MQFEEVLRHRRMVRYFCDEAIAADSLDRILAAALRAPSAGFSQGYALLVLETPAERERFWATQSAPTVPIDAAAIERLSATKRAPVLIAVLGSKDIYLERYAEPDKGWVDRDESRWPVPYWYVDAGFLALLMLLAAVNEGLGALLFGIPPHDIAAFRKEFSVPDTFTPIGCVAIGREDPSAPRPTVRRERRSMDQIVHRGGW